MIFPTLRPPTAFHPRTGRDLRGGRWQGGLASCRRGGGRDARVGKEFIQRHRMRWFAYVLSRCTGCEVSETETLGEPGGTRGGAPTRDAAAASPPSTRRTHFAIVSASRSSSGRAVMSTPAGLPLSVGSSDEVKASTTKKRFGGRWCSRVIDEARCRAELIEADERCRERWLLCGHRQGSRVEQQINHSMSRRPC